MAAKKPEPSRDLLNEYEAYLYENPDHGLREFADAKGLALRDLKSGKFRAVENRVCKALQKVDATRRAKLQALLEQEALEEAEDLVVILKGLRASIREAFTGDSPVFCDTHRDVLNAANTMRILKDLVPSGQHDTGPAILWDIDDGGDDES